MDMQKAVLFGAGGGGERLYDKVSEKYEIIAIVDNDKNKWGKTFRNLIVEEPKNVCATRELYDVIVLTSAPGMDSIVEQLLGYQIERSCIDVSYVIQPLESRRIFLQSLAKISTAGEKKKLYAVAEAGVFQGDFAKYINEYFPNNKFYMFDTFEGFGEEDIVVENEQGFSKAKIADYNNTSVEMVMKKMKYPELCVVRKGYFPQSANGIEDTFFFVNLDLDLYQPTLLGLKWFEERMLGGGVILIHDYFAENFTGVRQAVDTYMAQTKKEGLRLMPIGDGISIAIIGY